MGEADGAARHVLDLTITNDDREIDRINQAFNAFAEEHGLPAKIQRLLNLVFDELLSNIIHHAFEDDAEHGIEVRVELSVDRLTITLVDDGSPFDPFAVSSPDTGLSVAEREIGGLGIHLVRKFMDDISYHRYDDKNVVIVVKSLDAH